MCQVCTGYGKCHIHASWSGECNKYYNSPQSSVSVQSSFVTFISWPKGLHSHCLICLSFFPSNLHAAKVACVQHFPLFILPQFQYLRAVWVVLVWMCQSSAWTLYFFPLFCPTDITIRVKSSPLHDQEERHKGTSTGQPVSSAPSNSI